MPIAEIVVTLGGVVLIAGLAWFFFGPREARRAELRGGVQEVTITVKGGYSPDLIRARAGVQLRLTFDRREASDCTARVVFPAEQRAEMHAFFSMTPRRRQRSRTLELVPC